MFLPIAFLTPQASLTQLDDRCQANNRYDYDTRLDGRAHLSETVSRRRGGVWLLLPKRPHVRDPDVSAINPAQNEQSICVTISGITPLPDDLLKPSRSRRAACRSS